MNEDTKKIWRWFGLGAGLIIFCVVAALYLHQSRSRTALEKYIGELRAKGEKLTYTELYPHPPSTTPTSSSALFRAAGNLKAGTLVPGTLDLMKIVEPGRARVLWLQPSPDDTPASLRAPAQPGKRSLSSASSASWADLRDDIKTNEVLLTEIREALQTPAASSGFVPGTSNPNVPNFVSIRIAAQWLAASTINNLHEGETDNALEDLEALGAVGRLYREDPALVSQMIRVAVINLGLAATWETLQCTNLTGSQLQRIDAIWRDLDLLGSLECGLVGERAVGGGFWNRLENMSGSQARKLLSGGIPQPTSISTALEDYIALPAYRLTSIDDDHLFYLRTMQQNLEAIRDLRRRGAWREPKERLEQPVQQISRIANGPERFRFVITLAVLPNFAKAAEITVKTETQRQMTLTAIALQRYRLKFGKLPEKLDALIPEFLSAEPIDCLNGKMLRYRLNADATVTLYSVGDDGRDDGGDPTFLPKSQSKLTLWSGRDALWPSPVSAQE